MKNCYCRPKHGAGDRRESAYAYVESELKRMFKEQDNQQEFKPKSPPLTEYFRSAVEHCLKLANSGNVEAKKHLPEIFLKLALYYESGEIIYGIVKDIHRANEFLEMAVEAENINRHMEMV